MTKINILDSAIYNRIAAGEVVERPYSVVKELVENSIDARASKIWVDIVDGGIVSVKVTDDGCGIEKSELKKAFLPHATSKIADVGDLDAIKTLGFRGEAIASIASVSRMTIASKPAEQEFGAMISSEGGILSDAEECGLSDGTEITVNNLFFNTPARQKFLKSAKSEEGDISNIITRFILGNPFISFRYTANGKIVYQSYGDGLESAMLNVYGKSAVENCFYIDTEKHGLRLCGFIGKHHFTKPNRTYQSMFINGRYVINATLNSAITNAYSAYLMKRQYPFYVLNLTVPTEIVDVNVHPNKSDVRFSNNQIIYGSVYSVISKVLDGSSEAVNIVKEMQYVPTYSDEDKSDIDSKKDKYITDEIYDNYIKHNTGNNRADTKWTLNDHTHLPEYSDPIPSEKANRLFEENKRFLSELDKAQPEKEFYSEKSSGNDFQAETPASDAAQATKAAAEDSMPEYARSSEVSKKDGKKEQQSISFVQELKLIGQALDTYLILEDGKDLYFVDQHAAHERVLYDKFYDKALHGNIVSQTLLMPYTFTVNEQENQFIKSKLPYFNWLGIEMEEFGYNAYKISSVPAELADMDLKLFLDDCMNDILLGKDVLPDIIREKIAQKACKSAIKSGDVLDETDMKILMKLIRNNLGLKCPHGRPIAIKITRTEIDKWFKRIL